jgi:hypothetical protein
MCALLVANKLEEATHRTARIGWGALLAALVATSLLIASAAIAFLGATVAAICSAFFRDRHVDKIRLRTYLN